MLKLKNKNIVLKNDNLETKTTKTKVTHIPWIEKYRPKTMDELVMDECTRKKIDEIIKNKNMPNILITGVSGIGKTSVIQCIAHALLGPYYNDAVLEMNATDKRSIKTVQESVMFFCKKRLDLDPVGSETYAQHKIILLDEADNITVKAQQLVKSLMEEYSTTRFALTCNNSSDIIEAIQSRCIIFRFKRLDNGQVRERLENICKQEGVPFDEEGLNAIMTIAQGDLRKAINSLQITFNSHKKITNETVYRVCDKPQPITIKKLFLAVNQKNFKEAIHVLNNFYDAGYSCSDIAFGMINTLKSGQFKELSDEIKMNYLEELCRTLTLISHGLNTQIQLTGCIAKMCQ